MPPLNFQRKVLKRKKTMNKYKMRYVDSIRGSVIAFILFIIATIFIPGVGPSEHVMIILTVSTFIFAILMGYFLSGYYQRFLEIQKADTSEDAWFLSLYKTAQLQNKKFSDKIRDLIDRYYIEIYDSYGPKDEYRTTMPFYLAIWDELRKLKSIKNSMGFSWMLEELSNIEVHRNESSERSREKLGIGNWIILITLSSIILFCIFYLKTEAIYSQIITILLSTTLVLILLILRDLRNMMTPSGGIIPESGQEIFDVLGKPRYYNLHLAKKGWYKIQKEGTYRLGLHKPGEKLNIKLIKK